MRVAFLLVAAFALHGCTALGAGFAAELNRQHRADAQVSLADITLAPGDSLVLSFADGSTLRSAFASLQTDSVRLRAGAFALADIDRVERPWRRSSVGRAAAIGAGLDAVALAFLWYAFSNLTFQGSSTFF